MRILKLKKWYSLTQFSGILIMLVFAVNISWGQNGCESWQKIVNPELAEEKHQSFVIGNIAYIVMLPSYIHSPARLRSYDPTTNTLKYLADFPGGTRVNPIAFAAHGKGYIGLGDNGLTDIWEYNPATNIWTQKNNFPGGSRSHAVSFVINNEAYVATGRSGNIFYRDCWKYNAVADTWSKVADLPATARAGAFAFTADGKAYVGTGFYYHPDYLPYDSYPHLQDVWEYNPVTNTWASKSFFPGGRRSSATAFGIHNRGYVGTGISSIVPLQYFKDLWRYNPYSDQWVQLNDIGTWSHGTAYAHSFVVNGKGYVGTNYFPDAPYSEGYYAKMTPCTTCTTNTIIYDNNSNIPVETMVSDYIMLGDVDNNSAGQSISLISGSASVFLQAGNTITFEPGTEINIEVNVNKQVVALVQSCHTPSTRTTQQTISFGQTRNSTGLQVSMFPNPTRGKVNVKVQAGETSFINVTVFNLKGEAVAVLEDTHTPNQIFPVDLSHVAKGVYLVKVTTNKGSTTQRLVIN